MNRRRAQPPSRSATLAPADASVNRRRHFGEIRSFARKQVQRAIPALAVQRVQNLHGRPLRTAAGERWQHKTDLHAARRHHSCGRHRHRMTQRDVQAGSRPISIIRAACVSSVSAGRSHSRPRSAPAQSRRRERCEPSRRPRVGAVGSIDQQPVRFVGHQARECRRRGVVTIGSPPLIASSRTRGIPSPGSVGSTNRSYPRYIGSNRSSGTAPTKRDAVADAQPCAPRRRSLLARPRPAGRRPDRRCRA